MGNGSHQESGLSKSVWSDADFEAMGWHDATVHGLSVQPTNDILPRFLLDLDYIVRWVHPVPPATHFSFWISPATLVFEEVFDLQGDLDFQGSAVDLEIDGVRTDWCRTTPAQTSRTSRSGTSKATRSM
ncbi:hypothetical protein [Streptomyces sp. MT206]|uniref:hypothetical protein n=1 Tax=Streptomyces sp. MT206 TaxID=3031407 RepID=UPI002FCA178F